MNFNSEFKIHITEDGSPTLDWQISTDRAEHMHSRQGAFSETKFIYGRALEYAKEKNWPVHIFSLGLGLGYVEILAASIFDFSKNVGTNQPTMNSFEISKELRDQMTSWLRGDTPELESTYKKILQLTAEKHSSSTENEVSFVERKIFENLRNGLENGTWKIQEELKSSLNFDLTHKSTIILYDAFSSRSTEHLWTEDFLNRFLEKTAAPNCVFSTYAATGALNRVLKKQGFELIETPGFAFKRQSTFAVRTDS